MIVKIKQIQSAEDVKIFNSFTSADLTDLIVFRNDSGNLRSIAETEKCAKWMEMALGNKWDVNLIPRHHSSIDSSDINYRSSKITELLKECDENFIKNHIFFEFENRIEGKNYYCIAVFKYSY